MIFGRRKVRLVKIDEIERDTEFYPRERTSWIVSYKYSQALKTGEKFPPVAVAEFNGKLVLVDGWHRIEAHKINKEKFIEAEILSGLSPDQIYIEAVRRNTRHGQPLTTTEVASVILKLKNLRLPNSEISKIIHMPIEKIKPFVDKRTVNVGSFKQVLKKPTYHLSNRPRSIKNPNDLDSISGHSQISLIDEIILLLKNKWINLRDPKVKNKLRELKKLLRHIRV